MTTETSASRGGRAGVLAIVCLVLATATIMQASGWNQTSHYALTKSIAAGTAIIDPYRHWTGDKARFESHWYSSRAPGLALLSQPAYAALDLIGAPDSAARARVFRREGEAIWALGLWAALVPVALVLVLVRQLGDRLQAGLGAAAAVALGAGTLLLPFSTMLFSHALAAALGFAAFALLWHERAGPVRWGLLALAGVLVGLGIAVEYPTALVGIALGIYVLSRTSDREGTSRAQRVAGAARRGAVYAAGLVVGVVPLLAYNSWAFGSPTHLAYADLDAHRTGFFGVGLPDPVVALELLFSSRGLLTLAPVLILALWGIALLHRRGCRAAALTIGGVALAYLLYNAGYWLPFGGEVPGPRFLVAALPFLGVPLVLAFRRAPGPAIALTLVSTVMMGAATLGDPLIENEADTGLWAVALAAGDFQTTVVSAAGLADGWLAAAPFVLGVALALALAAAAAPRRLVVSGRQAALGAATAIAWALFAILGPTVLGIDASAGERIVAAGGSAAPEVDHGRLPLLELSLLALGIALAGLLIALVASRLRARGEPGEGGSEQLAARARRVLSPARATRA
jgi:hypothetical protein